MLVAGISFNYHDSSLSIVSNDQIIFADHEERYSRDKFDYRFPKKCIITSTKFVDWKEVEAVIFYEKPIIKLERQLFSLLNTNVNQVNSFIGNLASLKKHRSTTKRYIAQEIEKLTGRKKIPVLFSNHHLSHAASSFYTSPFTNSLVLVMDAVGEWESSSAWLGEGSKLKKIWSQDFPHSFGLFYSAMTQYLGLKVNSGEYKLMGLAPYGRPRFLKEINQLIQESFDPLVGIKLNLKYFDFISGKSMVNKKIEELFEMPIRKPREQVTQFHADVAASTQQVLEKSVLNLLNSLELKFGKFDNLCLAGGVALNCVLNSKLDEKYNGKVWIFPAAGDAGGSTGAAMAFHSHVAPYSNNRWDIKSSLLGNSFKKEEIVSVLKSYNVNYQLLNQPEAADFIAEKIALGQVVGIFDGRSEFGPRALGNRSIVADPRIKKGQIYLNEKIKFRESFRPFAPICLEEFADRYFYNCQNDKYMLKTRQVKNFKTIRLPSTDEANPSKSLSISAFLDNLESPIPSVTHLDGSARVQTIEVSDKRFVRKLLESFYKKTDCPVLINTSFNVRGEPIVGHPIDALRCLATTGIDLVYIEGIIVEKINQNREFFLNFQSVVSDD